MYYDCSVDFNVVSVSVFYSISLQILIYGEKGVSNSIDNLSVIHMFVQLKLLVDWKITWFIHMHNHTIALTHPTYTLCFHLMCWYLLIRYWFVCMDNYEWWFVTYWRRAWPRQMTFSIESTQFSPATVPAAYVNFYWLCTNFTPLIDMFNACDAKTKPIIASLWLCQYFLGN